MRRERVGCGTCRLNVARVKYGARQMFEAGCVREKCPLFAFVTLPNTGLWEWYERLIARQKAGLEGHVDRIVGGLDDALIGAFSAFHAMLTRSEGGDANG